jgi:hypothetical protein
MKNKVHKIFKVLGFKRWKTYENLEKSLKVQKSMKQQQKLETSALCNLIIEHNNKYPPFLTLHQCF